MGDETGQRDEQDLIEALRGGDLVPRASFFQLYHQRAGKIPNMLLIAHEDVLVFTRPPQPRSNRGGKRR